MKKRERQNTDGKSGFFVENSVRHLRVRDDIEIFLVYKDGKKY
jgi:hypothetical protein